MADRSIRLVLLDRMLGELERLGIELADEGLAEIGVPDVAGAST